jgi:glycosyltransferase involved in cell wall biosynthesis
MTDLAPAKPRTRPKNPLVSVIVRTVNRPHYLRECLESIARQDYRNVEVVLVNDGGPGVEPIVREFSRRLKFQLIELPSNMGRSATGNIGIDRANGEFLCFLDDDDIFYPFHLSTLVEAAWKPEDIVIYSDALMAKQIVCPFDSRVYMTTGLELVYSEDCSLEKLLEWNFIPILCGLVPRAALGEKIRFDVMLDVLEDWDFWIQLSAVVEFFHLPQITAEYRQRVDGTNTVGQVDHLWAWSRNYVTMKHSRLKGLLGGGDPLRRAVGH